MTKERFMSFYQDIAPDASACYDAVLIALTDLGIWSNLVMAGAMATVRVETGREFKPIEEWGSGQAYEGRKDLGNIFPGDGPKFKGRGLIQITGRSNYSLYGSLLKIDLINHPELALDITVSARILALFFKINGVNVACNAQNWVKVRQLVNGGNGIDTQDGGTTNELTIFKAKVSDYLA